jgi:hypothetical protein
MKLMKGEIKAHGYLPWVVYHGHVQMHGKFVILGALYLGTTQILAGFGKACSGRFEAYWQA